MKTAEVNFIPHSETAEEYQPTGFHYALVSNPKNGRKQCHTWIKCRDFLQDAVRNYITGDTPRIYGFGYDKKQDAAIDLARTRVAVKRLPQPTTGAKKAEFREMMESGLNLIHHFEGYKEWKPTRLYKVKEDQGQEAYLFLGPGNWVKSPVGVALYTFLIRLGYFKITFEDSKDLMKTFETLAKSGKSNDTRYLSVIYKHLYTVLDNYDKTLYKVPGSKKIRYADLPINEFHHRSGIVSLCQGSFCDGELKKDFAKILKK